jgi:hypothetical protein
MNGNFEIINHERLKLHLFFKAAQGEDDA